MTWEASIIIGSIGLTFFFIYLYDSFDIEKWYLKLLFLGFSFLVAINLTDTMRLIILQDIPSATALINKAEGNLKIILWAIRITFIVLFITTIINVVSYFKNVKLDKKKKKQGVEVEEE